MKFRIFQIPCSFCTTLQLWRANSRWKLGTRSQIIKLGAAIGRLNAKEIWTKSLKSILRFAKHNAFKNPLIPKQKKLYGYKIVAVGPIIFQNRISNFKCFLTTFSTVKTLKKQLQKKRLKIWIWISNFCSTWSLGHGLSGTVLTLLWNPAVAT